MPHPLEISSSGKRMLLRLCFYSLLFLLFLLLDQWSKDYVQMHYTTLKHIGERFHLYLHLNASGTLSFFKGAGKSIILIALGVFSFFIGLPLYFSPFLRRCHPYLLGITLTAAGAAGNIIDHIRLGYVVDFIGFTVRNSDIRYRTNLPVNTLIFNIADLQIIVGLALILLGAVRLRQDEQQRLRQNQQKLEEDSKCIQSN